MEIDTKFNDRTVTLGFQFEDSVLLEIEDHTAKRVNLAWITPKGARQMILALTEIADTYKSTADLFDAIQEGAHFHMNNDVAGEYVKLSGITYALIGGYSIRYSRNLVEGTTFQIKEK